MDCALETGHAVVNQPVDLRDARDRRVPATLSTSVLRGARGQVMGAVGTFRNLEWVEDLLATVRPRGPLDEIVSEDPHMAHVFDILPTLADSESSVLVQGETGTGKSMIARAIHQLSSRRDHPLITINCGALPETLLESELFGYRAGAFTGATRDRMGRLAAAEGGTVFLDEIGDMSLTMQVKLLRFLQDRVYERLGDARPIPADVRVVAATNQRLDGLVASGRFRRDLYYRINVLSIELPPLRDRPRDIPLLAHRFLERLSRQRGKTLLRISPTTLAMLQAHDFPGNIRELENIIEHAYVLCPGPEIMPEHLPTYFREQVEPPAPEPARRLQDLEGQLILEVLQRCDWNRQEAARELGVHKSTLLRRVKRLGLSLPRRDGRSRRPSSG
jgi:transcriptional regulator with PAS, ATPase and Fis domain